MAPSNAARAEEEKRVTAIISFAERIQSVLSALSGTKVSVTFFNELEESIGLFPKSVSLVAENKIEVFDRIGTALWNLCIRFRRSVSNEDFSEAQAVMLMARVYAFLLLDCAHSSEKDGMANAVRVMKVSLKTARSCLGKTDPFEYRLSLMPILAGKRYDLAVRVLEKAALYGEHLTNLHGQVTSEDTEINAKLSSEYLVLRMALQWRLDHLPLAEQMYQKMASSDRVLDPESAESLADVLFEMGRGQLAKKQYGLAVKWIERSYDILLSQELEKLSPDANELRISIMQSNVKALLGLKCEDALHKAQGLVNLLESEVGDKLVVLLLKLELLLSSQVEVFDGSTYGHIIQRMIRTVILTDSTFKLIIHHIRKLHDKSPSLACNIFDELIQGRIFADPKAQWVEAVLVNRVWMATNQRDSPDALASVESFLDTCLTDIRIPISQSAIFAVHTLLWKRIESNYGQGQYDAAEGWCRLAAHRLFEHAGDLNKAKIARKLLLCALAKQDIGSAREVFNAMADNAKKDPQTRFLMYKVALRTREVEVALEYLHLIYEASTDNPNLLYTCVLDAQEVGDKKITMDALQLVLQNCEYQAPSSVHLPALLRLTIRLATSVIETASSRSEPPDIRRQAQKLISRDDPNGTIFTANEIEWFSKISYNLAVKHCAEWEPSLIVRLLKSCTSFIDLYPNDGGKQFLDDASLRHLFCDYLAAILLVARARVEDDVELQLQTYVHVRRHVDSYDKKLQDKLRQVEGEHERDLLKKLAILIAYEFEAAIHLKAWDDLTEIILKAEICKDLKMYEVMVDCILHCDMPTNVLIPTLKRVVNATWRLEGYDITKLSRYMRCLFQYALPHSQNAAEELLDSMNDLAHSASESDIPYPAEELEWVATTAFNRAVDFYCVGQDTACNAWASKAIKIASLCPDNGALQHVLEEKFMGLRWDT
ncbi:MAG: hypothetical protein M1818_005099 [Claussenomyces sp. TS43310]|nr:MAG: hypothetical protein M1818_005099 [Claussenomyces sp. TS43310]